MKGFSTSCGGAICLYYFVFSWLCYANIITTTRPARFISELNLNMLTNDQSALVQAFGGDIIIDGAEEADTVKCYIMMKREKCTLGSYLKKEKVIPLLKALEITLGLLRIARALRKMEFSHSDIKLDNILCSVSGTRLCLTDLGQASSWAIRHGEDVMADGFHSGHTAPWRARYHQCSTKNNTREADETVDQFSVALLILQITLGRTHPIAQTAVITKTVSYRPLVDAESTFTYGLSPSALGMRRCLISGGPGAPSTWTILRVATRNTRYPCCKASKARHRARVAHERRLA